MERKDDTACTFPDKKIDKKERRGPGSVRLSLLKPSSVLVAACLSIVIGVALYTITPLGVGLDQRQYSDEWKKDGFQSHEKKHIFEMLRSNYTLNFQSLMRERNTAMKRFPFPHSRNGVDKREKLSLEEFKAVYDGKWPVIIIDIVPNWPAFNWTPEYFISNYGTEVVVMKAVQGHTTETLLLPLDHYLSHLNESTPTVWTYLSDELFLTQRPELRSQIKDPVYMSDNYFYLFPKEVQPWDCMLLWGTAHSRSSLHMDPYNWTGTNAVIYGKKLWKLMPPGQDHHLSVSEKTRCGFPMDCFKYNSRLDAFMPETLERLRQKIDILEVEQKPGEMLFIPSGWFHQAYNPIPTLAVSGQMMNSNNYVVVLEEIIKGGSISRQHLPQGTQHMEPEQLVKYLVSQLSPEILMRGAEVTANVLQQMKKNLRQDG